MSDIFESDIDTPILADEEAFEDEDAEGSAQQMEAAALIGAEDELYALRLEYSCENLYARNGRKLQFSIGDYVIVETRYGFDGVRVLGRVTHPYIRSNEILEIERVCDKRDLKRMQEQRASEADAKEVFCQKVRDHGLGMKFIAVHWVLCEPKVLFLFSAEGRVDFRELVRDLVSVFRTRIELRQIGVRDEARILGGMGLCGRDFCCHAMSDRTPPVSIRMAKQQGLSLNSTKVSGACGRLICCLAHEDAFYSSCRRTFPQEGTRLFYDGTNFTITAVNYLTQMCTLQGDEGRELKVNLKRFSKEGLQWRIV